MGDDPLVPFMPTGEHQVFRDWLDFVERVARPIAECDGAKEEEEEAMALYRQANPFFICIAFVFAMNRIGAAETERDRLRAVVDAAFSYIFALEGQAEAVVARARRSYEAAIATLNEVDELDGSEVTDG